MAYDDLRAFLACCDQNSEIVRIGCEVDPAYEIGAVCRKVLREGGVESNPILIFERPSGHSVPVVANVIGTRERYYRALDSRKETFYQDWIKRTAQPLPPVVERDGPCREVVLTGAQVDLLSLPIPTWNEQDAGPYITLPVQFSKDPDTGERNAGMYRLMVHDRNTLGMYCPPYRHLFAHSQKSFARGEAFPVAVAIGLDPVVTLSAVTPFPKGTDELAMAGAIRGEAVRLVPCVTIPVEVPATAEIVLECEMRAGETLDEAPFGEFTGYYGQRDQRHSLHVKAITHRRNPIYEGVYEGKPPTPSSLMMNIPMQVEIRRQLSLPGLREVNVCVGGVRMMAIASVEQLYEGHARSIGAGILATTPGRMIKTVILVDTDIDPFNWTEVEWALSTRCQAATDFQILTGFTGVSLDPSLPEFERRSEAARTSKVIIDATKPARLPYATPCEPKTDVYERVIREWAKYGIPPSGDR